MRDAHQGTVIIANLHSREQHRFYCFQQSTTFHTNSRYRNSQTITEFSGILYIIYYHSRISTRCVAKKNKKDSYNIIIFDITGKLERC